MSPPRPFPDDPALLQPRLAPNLQGQGPGLLLVHGFAASARVWDSVTPLLAVDHRVLAVTLPAPAKEEADFKTLGAYLARLVRKEGLARCLAVGHSMGGSLAALAVLSDPSAFRGLILVDASLRPGPPLTVADLDRFRMEPANFLREFLPLQSLSPMQQQQVVREALAHGEKALLSYLRHRGRDDLGEGRGQLRLPVALFTPQAPGRNDPGWQSWLVHGGFDDLPRFHVEAFQGCGHWIMWDDPSGFCSALRRFEAQSPGG